MSNVDTQSSRDCIVIQVIGETSNNSAELKKFVQTFVLAQQPTGYFVLNDIFRYISDEGEEEQVEAAPEETATQGPLVQDVEMPKAQAAAEEPVAEPLNAEVVDQKLEEVVEPEVAAEETPVTNGTSEVATEKEESSVPEPEAEPEVEEAPAPEVAEKEVEEEIKEPEKPKDPVPSPAPVKTEPVAKPAAPVQPSGPPKPMSWANRAAAAAGSAPRPAVPIVTPKTAPPAQPRAAPQAPKAAPAPAASPAPVASPATEKDKENVGWQSVGDSAKRQNRPQSISSPPEKEGTMGYVRNVTEKVQTDELREALGKHGNMIYFDVNRAKVSLT